MSGQPSPVPDARSGRELVHSALILVSGMVNLVLILVVCLTIVPKMDECTIKVEQNQKSIDKNSETLEQNWKELEEHRHVIRRLTEILDRAAKKAKDKNKPAP